MSAGAHNVGACRFAIGGERAYGYRFCKVDGVFASVGDGVVYHDAFQRVAKYGGRQLVHRRKVRQRVGVVDEVAVVVDDEFRLFDGRHAVVRQVEHTQRGVRRHRRCVFLFGAGCCQTKGNTQNDAKIPCLFHTLVR